MALTSLILQGSAGIWFNLLKSGEADTRTLHAACPVFVGSTWGKFPVSTSAENAWRIWLFLLMYSILLKIGNKISAH